jgi:positive phototaxis protein PixI
MNSSKLTLASKQPQQDLGDGYLKFLLNRQTPAVLSMRHTQEAIIVPVDSITPMPNMPLCVLGLMNWRSRIVWTVDLPKILNLETVDARQRQYSVVIIKSESVIMGLVVQDILGTTRFMTDEIRSPMGQVAASLVPYLRGCVVQEQEVLLVLDAQAIVQSSVLRND